MSLPQAQHPLDPVGADAQGHQQVGILEPLVRIRRAVAELEEDAPRLPDATRSLFARAEPYILVMRGAGLIAVVLAIFRPVLG